MADYQDIRGLRVKYLSADPSVTVAGEVWYNSTTGTLKSQLLTEGVSSGANLATGRTGCAGGGIVTAAWVSGGSVSGPPPTSLKTTEEYNGSGWATGGLMTTARGYAGSGGPQTAGIAAGGFPYPAPPVNMTTVESYNGTTWSGETALRTAVWTNGIIGSEPACVSVGRGTPSADNAVFNYDGSTWTTGGTRNNIRGYSSMAAGVQTAGIIAGGYNPPVPSAGTKVESYDGSTWTNEADCTADTYMGSLSGSQTSVVKMGGQTVTPPVVSNAVETYDGSSWATSPATLTTARGYVGMTGNSPSSSAGLISGGSTTGGVASTGATEEFNRSANVVVAGAWGSAPIMNTARSALGAARNGTQTSCLAFSGYEGSPAGIKTEEFDGSSWANKNSMGTGRYNTPGTGIVTAALAAGGNAPPQSSSTEEFDGTNWAANPTGLNTARYMGPLTGTQTAALFSGGTDTSSTMITATETYNGSAWTTSPATLNTGRAAYNAGAGTQTASVIWSGYAGPPGETNASEEFNGTSWTAGNNYLLSAKGVTGAGTLAAAWSASGKAPGNSSAGFSYDGTNWSTTPSLGTAKYNCAGGGASGAGIIFGGTTGVPLLNTTEEFTGATSTANIVTLTTS